MKAGRSGSGVQATDELFYGVARGRRTRSLRLFLLAMIAAAVCSGHPAAWAAQKKPVAVTTLAVTYGGTAVSTVASGTMVTMTATVTVNGAPLTPGQVKFCDATAAYCTDIHVLNTAQLTGSGTAVFNFYPGIGSHSYNATFVGTATIPTSSSAAASLSVTGKYATTTTLTSTGGSDVFALATTVSSAAPIGEQPTGTVSFLDTSNGNTAVGTAPLSPIGGPTFLNPSNPAIPSGPSGVATGDFNGDGRPDLAITSFESNSITVLLGKGDGTFTPAPTVSTGSNPGNLVAGDFNGDGKLDLAVVSGGNSQVVVSIYLGVGDGTFSAGASYKLDALNYMGSLPAILAADFDQDGNQDLAVTIPRLNSVRVLLGDGQGNFNATLSATPTGNGPTSLVVADFDNDGVPDMAVANADDSSVSLLLGNGDGTFSAGSTVSLGYLPGAMVTADFLGNGNADLALVAPNEFILLTGDGTGDFTERSTQMDGDSPAIVTGDFDGDGNADLALFNPQLNGVYVLVGGGNGTFAASPTQSIPSGGYGLAVADFNGDGRPDLAATTSNSAAAVRLTQSASSMAEASGISPSGVGTHQVVASYPGDGNNAPSASALAALTITQIGTTLILKPNPSDNPLIIGTSLTISVTVDPVSGSGIPTGSVTITIDGGDATTSTLNRGVATFSLGTTLPVGQHIIAASYTGSADFGPGTASLTENVAYGFGLTALTGGQTTVYGSAFATPLLVSLLDITGTPIRNAVVTFSGAGLSFSSSTATTDANGEASVTATAAAAGPLTAAATVNNSDNQMPAKFSLTATPAPLTVAAIGSGVFYGQPIPMLAYTITGFVLADTSSVVTGAPTVTTTATQGSLAGSYPIVVGLGTLAAANYNFNFVPGTLTIQPAAAGLQFVPVTPCRVVDTRDASGAFGGPALLGGAVREFDLPQSACNIPAIAAAYSLNVTVVPTAKLDYLTIWPAGQAQPDVSTLNSDGRIKANAAITPAGSNGGVDVYVSDATHVIIDIDGYFVPAGAVAALDFYPLTPCRVADTRQPTAALGGPSLAAGTARDFPIGLSNCEIPATAKAYSLNVTALPKTKLDYLTAWPAGETQPLVSTLNSLTGAIAANAAIVPAASNGDISIYVSDAADVVLDVNGYFAEPATGGLYLYTATPCRIIDTRSLQGTFTAVLAVAVEASPCAPPSTALAYVLNATVVPPGPLDYLTLWPDPQAQPVVSTLNALDGAVTSNMAIVPNVDGTIYAFALDPTNLILDLSSYFAP